MRYKTKTSEKSELPDFAYRQDEQVNPVSPLTTQICSGSIMCQQEMTDVSGNLDSITNMPEPVCDLPDDDWDAWLAGAKECPGRKY